jgi:hypothetical protein
MSSITERDLANVANLTETDSGVWHSISRPKEVKLSEC